MTYLAGKLKSQPTLGVESIGAVKVAGAASSLVTPAVCVEAGPGCVVETPVLAFGNVKDAVERLRVGEC